MMAPEDPTQRRGYKPPYWCETCDVGQSVTACWLCGQPCGPTRAGVLTAMGKEKYEPGSLPARSLNSTYSFIPEDVPEEASALGVTDAIANYDGGWEGPDANSATAASNVANLEDTSDDLEFGVTV